ncbi:endonuclease domain-containing protein [Brevundimonas sp.]|uniref:endonuclease domain-containing protein n=1 Tax=Brevundimonas sp. TaxID=1871086 RepID=UPI002D49E138|nr:endonuclease domain-containing protein [Brevundimonas sp.]HYD27624.1 endonuclease domain-containing protein [Brevundimonas sp.]
MVDFDRFAGPGRIKSGGAERGRRLRAAPTHAEAKLWERLRKLETRIRRQAPIGAYVVDFACLRAKLVIEVDGGVHERTDVALRDLERDGWLNSQGFRVLRVPNARVEQDLHAVVSEIEAAIRASLPNLTQPASTPSQPFPLEGKGFSDF